VSSEPEKAPSWSDRIGAWCRFLLRILESLSSSLRSFGIYFVSYFSKVFAPRQKTIGSPSPQDNAEKENAGSPDKPLIPPQVPPAPPYCQYPQTCRYRDTPWWMRLVEILGVAAVICYTVEAHRTNCLTQQALRTSKEQFTKSQVAAKEQFDSAQKSLLDQFTKDQRPYMWLAKGYADDLRINVGQQALWDLHFTNYGKSPAVYTAFRTQVVFGKDSVQKRHKAFLSEVHAANERHIGVVDAPGMVNHTTAVSDEIISPDDMKFILDHDFGIAVFAYFEYFDLSGNEYHSEVCQGRLKTGAIMDCLNEHNWMK
jgi:hypothetical protein